jgi:hypothetical protein
MDGLMIDIDKSFREGLVQMKTDLVEAKRNLARAFADVDDLLKRIETEIEAIDKEERSV